MKCCELRVRWARQSDDRAPAEPEVTAHLATCASCRRVSEALRLAREGLRAHHARVEPDSGFSARVLEGIRAESQNAANLAWAALRALPVALALVVALAAWGAGRPPVIGPETVLWQASSDDLLTAFVLSGAGGAP